MDLKTFHQYRLEFGEQEGGKHFDSHEESHSGGPHVHRHRLRRHQRRDDAVAQTVPDIRHDDADHRHEVHLGGDDLGQPALVHYQCEHGHGGEGNEDEDTGTEEQQSSETLYLISGLSSPS